MDGRVPGPQQLLQSHGGLWTVGVLGSNVTPYCEHQ